MNDGFVRTRVLITVKTYPHPSEKYEELVCVAGISDEGEWIRIYPVDFRNREHEQQFQKYQWIDVELGARGHKGDGRKESREPRLDSIKLIGEPLATAGGWQARREIIDRMPHHSLNELLRLYDEDRTSLGIVRPKRVLDLEITPAEREWKGKWQNIYQQRRMFVDPPKPLRKLPFEFRYVFECEDSDKPHRALITDWELGTLYLKEEARLGSEQAAVDSVKNRFFGDICRADKDTRFYMGTVYPYNQWIVIGTFWPPRMPEAPRALF